MAIMVECPQCKYRNPVKVMKCVKCEKAIPKNQLRIYWIDITLPDRRRKRLKLGAVTLDEAEKKNAEMKIEAKRQGDITPVADVTWWHIRTKFINYLEVEGRSEAYRQDSALYLRKMAEYWGDTISIDNITKNMVFDFRMKLRETGITEASCNRHLAAGKAAWRIYDSDKPNPFSIKFYHEQEKINNYTRFLTNEQREKLLSVAKQVSQDLYEIILIAIGTGWRKSEILSLKHKDVDFASGVAVVSQKRGRLIHRPLSRGVLDVLKSIPDNGTDYFWISKDTNKPYDKHWKYPWQQAKKLAGIDMEFRFHDLRHDFAIRAFAINRSQREVQELLGHHQASTTQRYVHVLPNYLRDVLDKMEEK